MNKQIISLIELFGLIVQLKSQEQQFSKFKKVFRMSFVYQFKILITDKQFKMFIAKIAKTPIIKQSLSLRLNVINSFSNLKDRFAQLKGKNHANHKQLYADLRGFQANLSYGQWVKFRKLIHEADKKVRRLNKVQQQNPLQHSHQRQLQYALDGSITSQYFYHKHTESTFYKQQIIYHKLGEIKPEIKSLSLQQLDALVSEYYQNDMQKYLFNVIPTAAQFQQLIRLVQLRYSAIQEILCRHIFKGYTQFSSQQQNLFFKTQQKYKGDFKFQTINPDSQWDRSVIHRFSQIARKLACMNQCRSKVQLAIQTLLSQNWRNLQTTTISNLLFCTSVNGKDLRQLTTNIDELANKLMGQKDNRVYFNLLFYMCISGAQNRQILERADLTLFQANKQHNSFEKLILQIIVPYLSQAKQVDFINLSKDKSELYQKYQNQSSSCLIDFIRFLDQRQYKYILIPSSDRANIIGPYQIVQIQQKKFLCYSSLFYLPSEQSNTPNGLAKIINEYFSANGQKIKIINGKQLLNLQKWTEKEEYLKTKMKGLSKPTVKREKKFQFYSPRQEHFQNKQSNKH